MAPWFKVDDQDRLVIVELVGPPGAGKSALQSSVVHLLDEGLAGGARTDVEAVDWRLASGWASILVPWFARRHPRSARTLLVDVPYALAFSVEHPRLVGVVIGAVRRSPVTWGHRALLLWRFAVVGARRRYLRDRLGDSAAVFDEGLLHRAVNLFAWRGLDPGFSGWVDRTASELDRYLDRVPPPDLAIYVDAPAELARTRVVKRGLPHRLRGREDADIDAFLRAAGDVASRVRDRLKGRIALVHVDNVGSLAEVQHRLAGLVGPYIRSGLATAWPVVPGLAHLRRPVRSWRSRGRAPSSADNAELADIVDAFGLGTLRSGTRIGFGRSWTVRAEVEGGTVLVKRYKAGLPDAAIACEHDVLGALEHAEVPAPRLVRGPDGATTVRRDGHRYAIYRFEPHYVPMHELLVTPGSRARLTNVSGHCLGLLHRVLSDRPPASRPETGLDAAGERSLPSAWHVERLKRTSDTVVVEADPGWGLAERLETLDGRLAAAGLRQTLIHGDYGPYNVLVRPRAPLLVVDFELARDDWMLTDLATAIPRFALGRLGFSARRADALVGGYLEAMPDLRGELPLLPSMLEFLSLRRTAVCLDRLRAGLGISWAREARRHAALAMELGSGRHPIVRFIGSRAP